MPSENSPIEYNRAIEDFKSARSKAEFQRLWSSITGKSETLLPYDEISKKLHATNLSSKGLKDIPVDAILGSVNRYQDFNRNFLPLHDEDMQRWARVKAAMTSPGSSGLPPIRVYKIGEVYFVLDGNHRVSIARQMGIDKIEAYVTEIRSRVSFTAEDSPEDIILKAEYANFLDETQIDEILPDVDFKLTFPGQYQTLKEHIRVHRHYMGIEQSREIPWDEAVRHWYDKVYQPIEKAIREQHILEEFPDRTETDLYIWVLDHQTFMEKAYGWSIRPEKAASDLATRYGRRFVRIFGRLGEKVLELLLPKQLEDLSTPGEWHEKKNIEENVLFSDVLVAMDGSAESWLALEQAIIIGRLEGANIRGLIIKSNERGKAINDEFVSEAFQKRLDQIGLEGNVAFAEGNVPLTICERALVNDLVILKLSFPPSPNIISRLKSGVHLIIRRSSRPVLLVRNRVSQMNRLLCAYDGSSKGKEALFISSYLVKRYDKSLTVLVVDEDEEKGQKLLQEAKDYLGDCSEHSIFRHCQGPVSATILDVAREESSELILIGGYGLPPLMEILFGSTVNAILRGTNIPILVCK
jgi:nucleotide-binding universal stress UspA family protein